VDYQRPIRPWRLPTAAELAPWRVRSGYAVALVYAWFADPIVPSLVLGAMVAAIGLLIRGAAAGYLRKNEKLTTSGPYAYTRNPLYFGSALLALGLLLAGNNWIAALLVAAYIAAFYPAVIRFEAAHLRKLHGLAYDDYAAHVPLFFPRLTPAPALADAADSALFSWVLYKTNREHHAAIGAGVAIVLLIAKMLLFD
jgi:protein-S-isoprenylcysteine O-methyltransferase Ste14